MTGRELDRELEQTIRAVEADLEAHGFPHPRIVRDTSGRYIMLDALTALANLRAALRQEPRASFKNTHEPRLPDPTRYGERY